MPELPEVETMRRGIAHLAGLRIKNAAFPRGTVRPIAMQPAADRMQQRLTGRTIAAVHRFGKRVAIELKQKLLDFQASHPSLPPLCALCHS